MLANSEINKVRLLLKKIPKEEPSLKISFYRHDKNGSNFQSLL